MVKLECVLDIMSEYLDIKESESLKCRCNLINETLIVYDLRIKNISDSTISRDMLEKIGNKINQDDNYIRLKHRTKGRILFMKTHDIDQLLHKFVNLNIEQVKISELPKDVQGYMEYYDNITVHRGNHCNIIVNREIQRHRQKKEAERDKKALQLLNDIL